MKKFKLLIIAMLSVFSMTAIAAEKIVVVNPQKVIEFSNASKLFKKKIQADYAAEQAALQALGVEVQAMKEAFNKDKAVLSEAQQRKAAQAIQEKIKAAQFQQEQLQNSVKAAEYEFLESMKPKLNAALAELMKQNKYDIILHAGTVVTVSPKLDISDKVIELIDAAK